MQKRILIASMEQHKALCDAMLIIDKARQSAHSEYGASSPAWSFLYDAGEHLRKQAEAHFAAMFRDQYGISARREAESLERFRAAELTEAWAAAMFREPAKYTGPSEGLKAFVEDAARGLETWSK